MIRLLVADDHPVVREGLRNIIDDCQDIEVVGEAEDADGVMEQTRQTRADVLLLDVSMPGPGFTDVMQRLRKEQPQLKVLVLSIHPEEEYAIRALRAGAMGYLSKRRSQHELAEAIRRVHGGGHYVTETVTERLALQLRTAVGGLLHEALSDREYQVLCLLGAGKSVKETAAALDLSPKTISTYRARVLQKMELRSTVDLARYVTLHHLEP